MLSPRCWPISVRQFIIMMLALGVVVLEYKLADFVCFFFGDFYRDSLWNYGIFKDQRQAVSLFFAYHRANPKETWLACMEQGTFAGRNKNDA